MWELIASMLGSDMQKDGMGQQTDYAKNGSNADEGLAATPNTQQPTSAGTMANNMATGLLSPYTKGIQGVQDLYNNPGDKQALGSVLSMLSLNKPKQLDSNMPGMPSENLGLPSSGMQGPMMPNMQSRRGGLANQAFGRYY
jgi:hypothetical protein